MTRYSYDTESADGQGHSVVSVDDFPSPRQDVFNSTIELISIGIVADDGREYYAVNRDFRWCRIAARNWWAPWTWTVRHQWLSDNVVPSLPNLHGDARMHYGNDGPLGIIDWQSPLMKSRARIADGVRDFLLAGDTSPELWAYYGAYDHVVLCQLWGRMIDLPSGIPMYTHDLMHEIDRLGVEPPEQESGLHNALADARWVHSSLNWLAAQEVPS